MSEWTNAQHIHFDYWSPIASNLVCAARERGSLFCARCLFAHYLLFKDQVHTCKHLKHMWGGYPTSFSLLGRVLHKAIRLIDSSKSGSFFPLELALPLPLFASFSPSSSNSEVKKNCSFLSIFHLARDFYVFSPTLNVFVLKNGLNKLVPTVPFDWDLSIYSK